MPRGTTSTVKRENQGTFIFIIIFFARKRFCFKRKTGLLPARQAWEDRLPCVIRHPQFRGVVSGSSPRFVCSSPAESPRFVSCPTLIAPSMNNYNVHAFDVPKHLHENWIGWRIHMVYDDTMVLYIYLLNICFASKRFYFKPRNNALLYAHRSVWMRYVRNPAPPISLAWFPSGFLLSAFLYFCMFLSGFVSRPRMYMYPLLVFRSFCKGEFYGHM